MTHPRALGRKVCDVVFGSSRRQRDPFDDLQSKALETAALGQVVSHQPDALDAEFEQDLHGDAILASVDRQPEAKVGVDCVVPLILEAVCRQLPADADAAALVTT